MPLTIEQIRAAIYPLCANDEVCDWLVETSLDEYRAIERAATPQWLPIETAPKDGTEIWAFNGEQGRMRWIECPGYGLWIWDDVLLSDADPEPEQPTHWMPLPPAPEVES